MDVSRERGRKGVITAGTERASVATLSFGACPRAAASKQNVSGLDPVYAQQRERQASVSATCSQFFVDPEDASLRAEGLRILAGQIRGRAFRDRYRNISCEASQKVSDKV